MRIVRIEKAGPPSVMFIETVAPTPPGQGQVWIEQEAIGVNYLDVMQRNGAAAIALPSGLGPRERAPSLGDRPSGRDDRPRTLAITCHVELGSSTLGTIVRRRLACTMPNLILAAGVLVALASLVNAAERFPPIPQEAMTPEQRAIAKAIASGPRKNGAGPFDAWLRSPALADRLQKVGEYVRFQTSLPKRLNEFAIEITGRWWNSPFEWDYHYPLAIKEGVPVSELADLARGVEPAGMSADEALVYRFARELRDGRKVSDATYRQALDRFGERGVIDLVAVLGYYDVVCMTLNVAEVRAPADSKAPTLVPITSGRQ